MAINPYDRIVPFNPIKSYIPQSPDFDFIDKASTRVQEKFDDTGMALDKVGLSLSNLKEGLASRGFAEGAQSEYAPQLEALQKELSTTGNVSAVTRQLMGLQQKFQSDPRVKFMTADYAKKAEGIAMRDDLTKRHGLQRLVNPDGTFNGQSWDNFDPNVNVDDLYSVISTPKQDMRSYSKDIVTAFVPEFNEYAKNMGLISRIEGDKIVFYDVTEKGTEKKLTKDQVKKIMVDSGYMETLWEDSHETLNYYKEEKRFREGREATMDEFMEDVLSLGSPYFFEHKSTQESMTKRTSTDVDGGNDTSPQPLAVANVPTGAAAPISEYNTIEEINEAIVGIDNLNATPQEKNALLTDLYEQKFRFEELTREYDQQHEGAYGKEMELKGTLYTDAKQGAQAQEKRGVNLVSEYKDRFLESVTIDPNQRNQDQKDMAEAFERLNLSDPELTMLDEILNSERVQKELSGEGIRSGGSWNLQNNVPMPEDYYEGMKGVISIVKDLYEDKVEGSPYEGSVKDMSEFLGYIASKKTVDESKYKELQKNRQEFLSKGYETVEQGAFFVQDGSTGSNKSTTAVKANWDAIAKAGDFSIIGDPWNRERTENESDDALKGILAKKGELYMLNFNDGTLTFEVDLTGMSTIELNTLLESYPDKGKDVSKLKKLASQGRTAFFRVDSPALDDPGSALGAAVRLRFEDKKIVDAFRLNGKINKVEADAMGEDIGHIDERLEGFQYYGINGTTMIKKDNGDYMSYMDLLEANQDSPQARQSLEPYLKELMIRGKNGDMKSAEIAVDSYVRNGFIPKDAFLNEALLGSDFNNPTNMAGADIPRDKLTLPKNAMFDTAMKLGTFAELTDQTFKHGTIGDSVSSPKLHRGLINSIKNTIDAAGIKFTVTSGYRGHDHPIEAAKDTPGAHSKAAADLVIDKNQEMAFLSLVNTDKISLSEVKDQWLTFRNGTMRMKYHQNAGNSEYHVHIEKI